KNPQVGKAVAKLMVLSEDEQARMIADSREKMRRDINAQQRFKSRQAEEKGMKKGMKKGMEKAMLEFARGMLGAGDSAAKISAITGLSVQQIQKLLLH
ncbi:MAG: hypothetical protein LBU43_00060, partial [Candidatus Accumulibacter sp.]|nr:hypothetical protein [Accumulibacter sp.]